MGNYCFIITEQTAEVGVPSVEFAKLAHRDNLENVSRALCLLARWISEGNYPYVETVLRMSAGARLFGESAIAMLELMYIDPS